MTQDIDSCVLDAYRTLFYIGVAKFHYPKNPVDKVDFSSDLANQ
jgi:hypothetical protein